MPEQPDPIPLEIKPAPNRIQSGRWVFSSTALNGPLQMITHVSLARLLHPIAFGLLGLANSTAVTLCGISSLGLDVSISRFTAETYRRDPPLGRYFAALTLLASLLLSTVFFTAAMLTLHFWGWKVFPRSTPWVILVGCTTLGWVNARSTDSINLLSGLQLFRPTALCAILSAAATLVCAILGGWWYGVPGALIGNILGTIPGIVLAVVAMYRFDPKFFSWRGSFHRKDMKKVMDFALPAWLGGWTVGPVLTVMLALLARQAGGGEALGVFNTANALRMLLAILPGVAGTVVGPAIIEEGGLLGRAHAYEKLLHASLVATSFITLPVLVLLLGWRRIMFMLYGHAYAGAAALYIPLVAGVAVGLIASPAQFAMVAKNKMWQLQFLGVVKAVVVLAFAWLWVPKYLGMGLAWAVLASELFLGIAIQEYCMAVDIFPKRLRLEFYGFLLILILLMWAAMTLPIWLTEVCAAPLAALVTLIGLRFYPFVGDWLTRALPSVARPAVHKWLLPAMKKAA